MKRILIPIVILAGLLLIAFLLIDNKPSVKASTAKPLAAIKVETLQLQPQNFALTLDSYGTVQPRTQSTLVAAVAGEIVHLSERFRTGSFFSKGDLLIEIDQRDYQTNLLVAQASLIEARRYLAEEQARSKQAAFDWQQLNRSQQPTDLVLRKPQLLAAEANLKSAQAKLSKATIDLERTQIRAPYDGRVLSQNVDLGQVVNSNTSLGTIFATDVLEIRLPIRNSDLNYIELPEQTAEALTDITHNPKATIYSSLYKDKQWSAIVVRTESAIDKSSRQLHVVAEINDPFNIDLHSGATIKIGEYVTAAIEAETIENAIIIPTQTIYQGSFVFIEVDNLLQRQSIGIDWQGSEVTLIGAGLTAGDKLIVTPLGQVSSATPVEVIDSQTQQLLSQRVH